MRGRTWVLVAAASVGGGAAAPITYPDWLDGVYKPQLEAHWPRDAKGRLRSGGATLDCTLTLSGGLQGCELVEGSANAPEFGDAALKMSAGLRAKPIQKDGRPAATKVRVPIEHVEYDREPNWLRKPNPGQFMAVYPTEALRNGVDGEALITCEISLGGALRKCVVASEEPAGMGFGTAALVLAPQFRMKPGVVDGKPVEGRVSIPLKWETHGRSGRLKPEQTIIKPLWASAPLRAEVDASYPRSLLKAPVTGLVSMNCEATADGGLNDCDVVSENPKGRDSAQLQNPSRPNSSCRPRACRPANPWRAPRCWCQFNFSPRVGRDATSAAQGWWAIRTGPRCPKRTAWRPAIRRRPGLRACRPAER
jgi:TonB family protein